MTDKPTVMDERVEFIERMAADFTKAVFYPSKHKRQWRETKSSLQDSVSRLEREVERHADRFRQAQERAVFNGRAALAGWATVTALAVLLAWKW